MPAIHWDKVVPVLISIGIIIAVAVLRNTSRTLAVILATMPIQIPLTLFIVYGGVDVSGMTERAALITFAEGLLVGIFATLVFTIALYLAARAGWSLLGMLGAGYGAWAVTLVVINLVRG